MTVRIDDAFLRDWPLPMPDGDADKEARGRIVVIAGSREMPGAAILAATAALRAGAGKLAIATAKSAAPTIAGAVPEARVIGLPETGEGGVDPRSIGMLSSAIDSADAILIGPGMQDETAASRLAQAVVDRASAATIVLDAFAMSAALESGRRFFSRVLLTPHAGEMAHLRGVDKQAVIDDPMATCVAAAAAWNATVALKGPLTCIAAAGGSTWIHDGGNIGLAVSGSGDTLAGIIAGLAARGAEVAQAAAWGVRLHALAGDALSRRVGPLGYLAREIPDEIPRLMEAIRRGRSVQQT